MSRLRLTVVILSMQVSLDVNCLETNNWANKYNFGTNDWANLITCLREINFWDVPDARNFRK